MHRKIWLDGHIRDIEEARISPAAAGVLSGFGVYTTLRLYGGVPYAFDRHWARLADHARRSGVPLARTEPAARAALADLARANGARDALARITALRGHAGLWQGAPGVPDAYLMFMTSELRRDPADYRLHVASARIDTRSPAAGIKVTGNLDHLLSLEAARAEGCDEAVLLNERDEVAEAATANLFWLRGATLHTPSLATGCLEGVIREQLLELAPALGLSAEEGRWPLDHLLGASEVFLTSAGREVAPVRAVGARAFPGAAGPVATRLRAAFHERVLERIAR
jgi:branched-subunit amino acid aminotransferase/4-amino-4-deoxychorismate lyase